MLDLLPARKVPGTERSDPGKCLAPSEATPGTERSDLLNPLKKPASSVLTPLRRQDQRLIYSHILAKVN
jgi:hypothetical protein